MIFLGIFLKTYKALFFNRFVAFFWRIASFFGGIFLFNIIFLVFSAEFFFFLFRNLNALQCMYWPASWLPVLLRNLRKIQGWEFTLSLFCSLLFTPSLLSLFTPSLLFLFTPSLLSLFKNKRPWANHSCRSLQKRDHLANSFRCSFQKRDHERFAQFAHDKRAKGAIFSFSPANRSFALSLKKN